MRDPLEGPSSYTAFGVRLPILARRRSSSIVLVLAFVLDSSLPGPRRIEDDDEEENEHDGEESRWRYGWGPYSGLWVDFPGGRAYNPFEWDRRWGWQAFSENR